MDPDTGVERETVDEGAAAVMREGVRIPRPPVHLGGLERGQGIDLALYLVVANQSSGGSADHTPQNAFYLLVPRGRQGHEASGTCPFEHEHPHFPSAALR
jgi:hypothetical protein